MGYQNIFRLAFARNKMGQILRAGQSSYQPKPVQSKAPQASYLNLNKQVLYLLTIWAGLRVKCFKLYHYVPCDVLIEIWIIFCSIVYSNLLESRKKNILSQRSLLLFPKYKQIPWLFGKLLAALIVQELVGFYQLCNASIAGAYIMQNVKAFRIM